MKPWQRDKQRSDRYLPAIKRILGEYLIDEPPIEEDTERNTDLMVLRLDAIRIGCRVRNHRYIKKYGHEFTIRSVRPSGAKTEMRKILEGWGDYFFYGFGEASGNELDRWFIGDYKAFRSWFVNQLASHRKPWEQIPNRDRSSDFMVFNVGDIPNFVVASNWFKQKSEQAA